MLPDDSTTSVSTVGCRASRGSAGVDFDDWVVIRGRNLSDLLTESNAIIRTQLGGTTGQRELAPITRSPPATPAHCRPDPASCRRRSVRPNTPATTRALGVSAQHAARTPSEQTPMKDSEPHQSRSRAAPDWSRRLVGRDLETLTSRALSRGRRTAQSIVPSVAESSTRKESGVVT